MSIIFTLLVLSVGVNSEPIKFPLGLVPCNGNQDCVDLKNAICVENFCKCQSEDFVCEENSTVPVNRIGLKCSTAGDCNNIRGSECSDDGKCVCKDGMVASNDGRRCLRVARTIGDVCEESVQCYTKTPSTGCQQNKCVCQQHMHENNGSCYRDVELGGKCLYGAECSLTESSSCINSKCLCNNRHIQIASRCLPMANGMDSTCVDNAQCVVSLGEGSECSKSWCQCKDLYQYKSSVNKCVKDLLLGEICSDHSQCHQPGQGPSRLECILGKCRCQSSYRNENGYCISGSSKKGPMAFFILLLCFVFLM